MKIKFPKNLSKEKIKNFFKEKDLGYLVNKETFFVDGYEVTKKDYNEKIRDKKGNFDIRKTKNPQPPELNDLYRLYQFIILNKRTTILEFGCGHSSLVMAKALEANKKKFGNKKPFSRCIFPFQLFILDNVKKYLNLVKKNLNKLKNKNDIKFHFSEAQMVEYQGNFATEYLKLPRVNPDFIYLDGPNPFTIKNTINNFTVANRDMMPMSCDILKLENFLTPGTIILIDGRTANARFLINHLKRKWKIYFDDKNDQTTLILNEKPLGPFNREQIKFYNNKN